VNGTNGIKIVSNK